MPATIIPRLTMQHFYEMEALELQFYDAEFITPAAESWSWYELYPYSTVAAEVDGKLAGFVNLFPTFSRLAPGLAAEIASAACTRQAMMVFGSTSP